MSDLRRQTGVVRGVVALAIGGAVALILAVLTGSTPLAIVVVALAFAGIVQLIRDWRGERTDDPRPEDVLAPAVEPPAAPSDGLAPDNFTPDISTDPNGPSSNARVDHT